VSPNLRGLVLILSDCLGALNKVRDLPPYRIPTQCSHSDILKNIMANCSKVTFTRHSSHVKAHQDDGRAYGDLPREAQLNCQMDYLAKTEIYEAHAPQEIPTRRFPLEPICVFLGRNKLTSDKGEHLRFWVHKQLASSRFREADILFAHQFDKVDWESVHTALRWVPRMFRIWACKQVMDIALANGSRLWEQSLCPLCPSCTQVSETYSRILFCNHAGRVDVLMKSIELLESWLVEVETDPDLWDCIVKYAKGRGGGHHVGYMSRDGLQILTDGSRPRYHWMATVYGRYGMSTTQGDPDSIHGDGRISGHAGAVDYRCDD
jgi:hypothetical protein